MDNKRAREQVGIARNDEPTRFLSKEEMEQLEQAINQQSPESPQKEQAPIKPKSHESKIKIEDISEVSKPKVQVDKKVGNFMAKVGNIIRKIIFAIVIILVAVIGFSLAFTWYSPKDKDTETKINNSTELTDRSKMQNEKIKKSEVEKVNNDDADFYDVSKKIDHVKSIVDDIDTSVDNVNEVKSKITDLKDSAKVISSENVDSLDGLKLEVENLIKNFFN